MWAFGARAAISGPELLSNDSLALRHKLKPMPSRRHVLEAIDCFNEWWKLPSTDVLSSCPVYIQEIGKAAEDQKLAEPLDSILCFGASGSSSICQ